MRPAIPVLLVLFASVAAAAQQAPPTADAGDPAKGQRLFGQCIACHTVDAGGKHRIGPNLHGIVGAAAGTRPDFANYSEQLKSSGIVWTDDKLDAWLKKPAALVPGTRMAYVGLAGDRDRADLIAWLKSATK